MKDLFFGYGIAHSIMLLAFVIGGGIFLGRFKFKGISLGSTWILFLGILMGHLGFSADLDVLHFVKEFGLILFVFSIGLQVGPGFFHSFKSGGVKMNLLAAMCEASEHLASAYAVAYPMGVIGVILVILLGKALFRIDPQKELEELKAQDDVVDKARRMHVAVENPAIFGKKLQDVLKDFGGDFVVSRVMKGEQISFPGASSSERKCPCTRQTGWKKTTTW